MDDFSEFKHRSTLRGKLCELLCHLLSHPSGEQEGDTDAFLKENTGLLVQFVSSVKVRAWCIITTLCMARVVVLCYVLCYVVLCCVVLCYVVLWVIVVPSLALTNHMYRT